MIENAPIIVNGSDKKSKEEGVYLLNRQQVEHYWPQIESELTAEPELWNNWWTLEALFEGVMEETIQVWVVNWDDCIRAVFMTQILCAPVGRILQIFWLRGKLTN